MADPVEALGLEDEQKRTVQDMIKKAKEEATLAATQQAKLDFRAGVAGSRRPDMFDPATTHISAFFDNYEPFRAIMSLDGSAAINTLLTYLDRKSLNTLVTQNVTATTDWNTFRENAIAALSSPKEAVKARFELKKAKQRPDESVAQFGERLIDLAKLGYKLPDEQAAMISILKDALSGGVIRDEIAIALINMKPDSSFKDFMDEAVKLDSAYRARSSLRDEDNVHVSVLKNEVMSSEPESMRSPTAIDHSAPLTELQNAPNCSGIPQGSTHHPHQFLANQIHHQNSVQFTNHGHPQQQPANDPVVQCYRCHAFGHYASGCPNLPLPVAQHAHSNYQPGPRRGRGTVCHYCGIPGHIQRDCRKRLRDEGRAANRPHHGQNWSGQGGTGHYPSQQILNRNGVSHQGGYGQRQQWNAPERSMDHSRFRENAHSYHAPQHSQGVRQWSHETNQAETRYAVYNHPQSSQLPGQNTQLVNSQNTDALFTSQTTVPKN